MPHWVRFGGASSVERSVKAIEDPRWPPKDFDAGPELNGVSSLIVFHSPQPSQRPDHLVDLAPHALQVNNFCAFAIGLFAKARCRLQGALAFYLRLFLFRGEKAQCNR
jgi:hypothetical protein